MKAREKFLELERYVRIPFRLVDKCRAGNSIVYGHISRYWGLLVIVTVSVWRHHRQDNSELGFLDDAGSGDMPVEAVVCFWKFYSTLASHLSSV